MTDDNGGGTLYDKDFWHSMNQGYAVAGLPPIMPEDWARTEAMDNAACLELPHDRDSVARRLAGNMVKAHIRIRDLVGKRTVWPQWCPEHNESRPDTMASLYVLTMDQPSVIIALRDITQLAEAASEALVHQSSCEARVTRWCEPGCATDVLTVKRGEYICAFKACRACMQHIRTGAGFNDDYVGADQDWIDDRKPPEAEPDEIDQW